MTSQRKYITLARLMIASASKKLLAT